MSELKTCPFCDKIPIGPERSDAGWWIECEECGLIMTCESRDQLDQNWHRRNRLVGVLREVAGDLQALENLQ